MRFQETLLFNMAYQVYEQFISLEILKNKSFKIIKDKKKFKLLTNA